MGYEIPDLPEGWVVSTNTDRHISISQQSENRSLALIPHNQVSRGEWKLKELAGGDGEYPIYATEVDIETGINQAVEVVNTIAAGDTPTPTAVTTSVNGTAEEQSDEEADELDDTTSESDTDNNTDNQPSKGESGEDTDDSSETDDTQYSLSEYM